LIICAGVFVFTACNDPNPVYGEELVVNGGFEDYDTDTQSFTAWDFANADDAVYEKKMVQFGTNNSGIALIDGVPDATYGSQALELKISSGTKAAAWAYQTVPVISGATYRIKISYRQTAQGTAGIRFLENVDAYVSQWNIHDKWTDVTLYVKPLRTDNLTISLRVDSPADTSAATVRYDKISAVRIENFPEGFSRSDLIEVRKVNQVLANENVGGILFVTLFTLFGFAVLVCAYVIIRRTYAKRNALTDATSAKGFKGALQNPAFLTALVLVLTFVVRIILAATMQGFGAETKGILTIADELIAKGTLVFYVNNPTSLASPGMLYILSIVGGFAKLFGVQENGAAYSLLLKIPAIVADMAAVAAIFLFGKKYAGNKIALVYSVLYALLPVAFVLSGIRGSFDSILAALLLITFILIVEKKHIAVFVTLALALLLSLHTMAIVPLILVYFIYLCYKAKRDHDDKTEFNKTLTLTIVGFVSVFIFIYLASLPFTVNYVSGPVTNEAGIILSEKAMPFYIVGKYRDMIQDITYFVSNNFNLYGMVGMNGKIVNANAPIFNIIFIVVLVVYIISLYMKNRNRLELMLLASFSFAVLSVFSLKNTETYMFLSFATMLGYLMIAGEKRLYFTFAGLSLLNFLNIAQLMSNSGFVTENPLGPIINFESSDVFYIFMSVITVLFVLYYGYLTYVICNSDKRKNILPMPDTFAVSAKKWFKDLRRYFTKS
jgi:Gpi18-like mannosyltransferase